MFTYFPAAGISSRELEQRVPTENIKFAYRTIPNSMNVTISDILSMSVPERILLVETIWDSIPSEGKQYELNSEQIKILAELIATVTGRYNP